MEKKRRRFNADFKLKVVLETLKERQSLSEIAQKYQLHPNQVPKWKTDFLAQALDFMNHQVSPSKPENDVEKD